MTAYTFGLLDICEHMQQAQRKGARCIVIADRGQGVGRKTRDMLQNLKAIPQWFPVGSPEIPSSPGLMRTKDLDHDSLDPTTASKPFPLPSPMLPILSLPSRLSSTPWNPLLAKTIPMVKKVC